MANNENQKLKLLYVRKILMEYTDEDHPMSAEGIIDKLDHYDISAERKSIYADIECLRNFGDEIEIRKDRDKRGYYIAEREYSLPELKVLIDAVSSSRFITENNSTKLIEKLSDLASKYDAEELKRDIYVYNRVKTKSEYSIAIVDSLHRAIRAGAMITFQYMKWNREGTLTVSKTHKVSPRSLAYADENYYLIANDMEKEGCPLRHYRVDKIRKIIQLEEEIPGEIRREKINLAKYLKPKFGMYSGTLTNVELKVREDLLGVLFDRFGTDLKPITSGNGFLVNVEAEVSPQFFGFLAGLGAGASVQGPPSVKKDYQDYLKEILKAN